MADAYRDQDTTQVVYSARTVEGAQRIINRVVGDKTLTVVTAENRPALYDTALVLFPGSSCYTLHDTSIDGRLNQCLLTVVIDEISFDACAFLDLTAGEQVILLRHMTAGERFKLAVDVAAYFRSVGGSHTAPAVLDSFYTLMELHYDNAPQPPTELLQRNLDGSPAPAALGPLHLRSHGTRHQPSGWAGRVPAMRPTGTSDPTRSA